MSMSFELLAMLLTTASPAPATCSPDPAVAAVQTGAEAAVRGAETEWAASIATNEAAFLRLFTANGFVAIFDGKVFSRAALIAIAEKRRPGTAADRLEALEVHLHGATAVAEGSEVWSEIGGRHQRRIVWSDLWVHCRGAWRLVAATSIGAPTD